MAANNDELTNVVETEIIKGEQDDVLEKYLLLKKKKIQKKQRSKTLALRIMKVI